LLDVRLGPKIVAPMLLRLNTGLDRQAPELFGLQAEFAGGLAGFSEPSQC